VPGAGMHGKRRADDVSGKRIIAVIAGPTAVGKTEMGIRIAEQWPGAEIVSVDSRQIFRYMDIGTAKPTSDDQKRAVHHLIDIKDPDQPYSAGQYSRDARLTIEALWAKGALPILVGGSGLYLQALLDGLFLADGDTTINRGQLRERLAQEGLVSLYGELGDKDPVAQSRLAPGDTQRILRALELAGQDRGTTVRGRREGEAGAFPCLPLMFFLDLDREKLYQRIDQRVDMMLAEGLVAEVESLLERGYDRNCRTMGTLGYREILDFLDQRISLGTARELIKRRSRQYAKRQWTWFRRDRRLRWLAIDQWGIRGIEERILAELRAEMDGQYRVFSIDSWR
jgi:tRNA dimethylallyltransferase